MNISRLLPNSNLGRNKAIDKAHEASGNQPPGVQVLNADTLTRLGSMFTAYNARVTAVNNAQSDQSANTGVKDAAVAETRTFTSHFLQVFNFGVVRGKYTAAQRARFGLPTDSDKLPSLITEADVVHWAKAIVTGDAARVTAGGAAMANPDAAEVGTALSACQTAINAQAARHLALNNAQEALDALNVEADALIKRVWNEVETFYSEESPSSMRDKARAWGVVYVTRGPAALLTGRVLLPGGAAAEGAVVTVVQGGAKATCNAEGRYIISTTVLGAIDLKAELPPHTPGNGSATIADHEEEVTVNVGDIVLG